MSTTPISPVNYANAALINRVSHSNLYGNPNFDYLSQSLPKDIKQLFQWCELVYANAPIIANGVKKLINYPLTDFTYKTNSETIRKDTQELVEDILDMRSHLVNVGVDYYIYGNCFRSLYFPFDRYLKCSFCNRETNIKFAKYKLLRGNFVMDCECGNTRRATVIDKDSHSLRRVRLVNWDPNQINLSHNPITSETTYYYSLPSSVLKGMALNEPTMINTLPRVFLDAYFKQKSVVFGRNLFHLKAPGLSGYASGWGISPLMSALKPYLYTAVLRKASEAIGMEHITPKNILFPQATTSDPSMFSNMGRWKEEIEHAIKKWRVDPNHVMTAPYPTGSVNVGSHGRALTPTAEIREANQEMALAIDVPPHFIYGTGTLENSTVSLRILENQLTPYTEQLVRYANWVIDTINAKTGKEYCHIDLTPFTLADDTLKKQILMQIAGTAASQTTLLEALSINPDEEREKMKLEQIDAHRRSKEIEREIIEEEQNIANQTREDAAAEGSGTVPAYNQQKLMASAQEMAQEMIMVPFEQRKSYLSQLQNEDFVMWAMVSKILESMHNRGEGPGSAQAPPQ